MIPPTAMQATIEGRAATLFFYSRNAASYDNKWEYRSIDTESIKQCEPMNPGRDVWTCQGICSNNDLESVFNFVIVDVPDMGDDIYSIALDIEKEEHCPKKAMLVCLGLT